MRSTSLFFFADTVSALKTVRDFVTPAMHILTAVASLICVLFIVYAGYQYMMSRGKPDQLEHAKELVKKAILGLVLVLAATTLVAVLTQAYGSPQAAEHATLPHLETVQTKSQQNGLLETVITMITGLCSTILNTLAAPVLHALEFFTTTTPLMATNKSVFNLWLVMTGIANSLLVLVLGLLGLQIMSAQSFGLEEVDTKQILPRVGLIFLLMNSSIFLIDSVISLSNVLITAIGQVSGVTPVWRTLTGVVEKTAGQGIAALCIMIVFVICAVALLIYYVMRLVTLYIGTVLSPLVSLLWLVPGFRDFAETALKTYLTTIFVIFYSCCYFAVSLVAISWPCSGTTREWCPDGNCHWNCDDCDVTQSARSDAAIELCRYGCSLDEAAWRAVYQWHQLRGWTSFNACAAHNGAGEAENLYGEDADTYCITTKGDTSNCTIDKSTTSLSATSHTTACVHDETSAA